MTNSEIFESKQAPSPVGPYSQAIAPTVPGRPVFLSGQIGLDPQIKDKPTFVEGGIEGETRQTLANIKAVLAEIGLKLSDVLSMDVLLADMKDFATMNKVYKEEFGEHKPARAAYEAGQLPLGAKVEMKAIAWQPQNSD